jgi:hypothetical protein
MMVAMFTKGQNRQEAAPIRDPLVSGEISDAKFKVLSLQSDTRGWWGSPLSHQPAVSLAAGIAKTRGSHSRQENRGARAGSLKSLCSRPAPKPGNYRHVCLQLNLNWDETNNR